MKSLSCALAACALLALSLPAADVTFTAKPKATRDNGSVKITFAVSTSTDVEVAIVNATGRVVRSLAAGVIGTTNRPPAPLQPGLAQALEWDGKGDWNLPIGDGPFTVRVRAGMGVQFGGFVADSPYNFNGMYCGGMAVDPKSGDLYYLAKRGRDAHLFCLRVYDRTGTYLREIMPFPAGALNNAQNREAFGALPIPGSDAFAPINRLSLWPVFYPVMGGGGEGTKLLGLNPADPGHVLLVDEYFTTLWRVRRSDGSAGAPFAEPLWDAGKAPGGYGRIGPVVGAFSPDGKLLYFTGYCSAAPKGQKLNPKWPEGRVYRMEVGKGKTATFVDVPLPEKWKPAEEPWATPANGNQALHGIAVDKDGNVLVCDAAAGAVRVLAPDGKETGQIVAPGAYALAPDLKSGALYVVTRAALRDRKLGANALVKYESCKPGAKPALTLPLPRGPVAVAGDFSQAVPQLWVADAPAPYTPEYPRSNLLRIEEKDGKFVIAEDLANRGKTAAGVALRMDVDPEADLVYLHDGWSDSVRFNGLTGEYAGKIAKNGMPETIPGSELCVRRDGMVYYSGASAYGGPWARLTRDLAPAPLADGRKQFLDRYGKMGGGYFGNQGSCVTPDGHLYFNGMFSFRINALFEANPDGTPGRSPRLTDLLAEKPAAGGFKGALIGPLQDQSGGVEVDQMGNIYVGINLQVEGRGKPAELAKVTTIGTVVKFGPDGGGMLPDPAAVKPGAKYACYKNPSLTMPEKPLPGLMAVTGDGWAGGGAGRKLLEGALNAYPLLGPFSGSEGCACQTPRFEVDDFGRLYLPNALTCSVRILDNEGNEILRFGSYGNFDAPGTNAAKSVIPLAYPVSAKASFHHIYVADSANRRAVRVDPTWTAEATCEVK